MKIKQITLSRITDDRSPIANHRSLLTADGYPEDPISKIPDKKEKTSPDRNRRRFLTKLWIGLGIVAIGECIAVIITFLRPVKTGAKSGELSTVIEAGPVASFPPHSVTAFVRGKFYLCPAEGWGVPGCFPQMYAPRMHGPLGGYRKAICLPLPRLGIRYQRRGPQPSRAEGPGPLRPVHRK